MNIENPPRSDSVYTDTAPLIPTRYTDGHWLHGVSWPAIFAGVATAFALEVLFVFLGASLGFTIFTPLTDDNPFKNVAAGAIALEGACAVVALWFGGWVTGRFTSTDRHSPAWLHGFIVWCTATVLGVCIVSSGAAWAFGGLSKIVGGGLSMIGKPAAEVAEHAASEAKGALQRSTDTVSSFVSEAASNQQSTTSPGGAIRTKRNLGFALSRLFDPAERANITDDHAAAVKVLVENAGMSQADAEKTVTDWTAEYDSLQAQLAEAKKQAEVKAREAANEASKDLAVVSLCAFVAFLLGGTASTLGSSHGAKATRRCESRQLAP